MINSNQQEPMFIKVSTLSLQIWIDEYKHDFWFTKRDTADHPYNGRSYLHFIDSSLLKLHNYSHAWTEAEIKEITNELSADFFTSKYECEFIIPMRFLDSVFIHEFQAEKIIDSEHWDDFINEICNANKFSCSLRLIKRSEL